MPNGSKFRENIETVRLKTSPARKSVSAKRSAGKDRSVMVISKVAQCAASGHKLSSTQFPINNISGAASYDSRTIGPARPVQSEHGPALAVALLGGRSHFLIGIPTRRRIWNPQPEGRDDGGDQREPGKRVEAAGKAAGILLGPADRGRPEETAEIANRIDPGDA